jgi:hypothetical protein
MKLILAIIMPAFLFAGACLAQTADLYTGEAVVQTQQMSERRQAFRNALEQVLRKLSGLRYLDDYPLLEPALSSASDYVVSFHYRNVNIARADGGVDEQQRLVAAFSEVDVNELLKRLQMPLWQPDRAPAVIWVVVDEGLDRRIMPLELAYAHDAMNEVAARRGLPVIWPEPDENGDYAVDVQLLWGGYTEDLTMHGGSEVLVAAARREGPEWNVRWNLAYGDQNWTWRNRDIELSSALVEGLEQAVDEIAALYTIAAVDQGSWVHEITVAGLSGSGDYRRCLAYLQEISLVEAVSVTSAAAGRVTFSLELNALPAYLEQAVQSLDALEYSEFDKVYTLLP